MIYRHSDGSLINIKKNDYKNDYLFYKKIMLIKNQQKQETVQSHFIVKESNKNMYFSNQAIQKLLDS